MDEELLFASNEQYKYPQQWLSDGSILFLNFIESPVGDFYLLPASNGRKPLRLLKSEFAKGSANVSADGRWVAYQSEESGQWEIYLAAFPTFTERRRVSSAGGCQPRWRKDGRELFYLAPDGKMMSVEVTHGAGIETGAPKVLFQTPLHVSVSGCFGAQYCVTGDGQRFILPAPVGEHNKPLTVVLNWSKGLKP